MIIQKVTVISIMINKFSMNFIKPLTNIFESFGLGIHKLRIRSGTMYFPLKELRHDVDLVIDVGVAEGTADLYRAYPKIKKILVEPLDYFVEKLKENKRLNNVVIIQSCASDRRGKTTFFVRSKRSTSSINQGSSYDEKVEVPTECLDVICAQYLIGNEKICLKIDTEGSEIKVLKGAEKILNQCSVVVAEATLYPTLSGANSMFELIEFMAFKGFKIHDIVNIRKSRGTFDQCDIIFTPTRSI